MTTSPPPLIPPPEKFRLLRGFLIVVSLYNVFNLTAILAYMEHKVLALLGLTNPLAATAMPLVLVTLIAMILQSVFLCRFDDTARRLQMIFSGTAPFARVWLILTIRELHPERITTTILILLSFAIVFDLLVVLVVNSRKAQRATKQLR